MNIVFTVDENTVKIVQYICTTIGVVSIAYLFFAWAAIYVKE